MFKKCMIAFMFIRHLLFFLFSLCVYIKAESNTMKILELDTVVDRADYRPTVLSILAVIRPHWKAEDISMRVSFTFLPIVFLSVVIFPWF